MSLLYVVPATPTCRAASPRASGGASLTVDHREETLGSTFPANVIVFRGSGVLTVLIATARVGKILTISGPAENLTDHAVVAGDGIGLEPTAAGSSGVVLALLGTIGQGSLSLPTSHDAAAPVSSVYLSLDQLDTNSSPKLTRKDSAGNVNAIG